MLKFMDRLTLRMIDAGMTVAAFTIEAAHGLGFFGCMTAISTGVAIALLGVPVPLAILAVPLTAGLLIGLEIVLDELDMLLSERRSAKRKS